VQMRQFDVFDNPARTQNNRPYLVVVQHRLILDMERIVVVPLAKISSAVSLATRLTPLVAVNAEQFYFMAFEITNAPSSILKHPRANLEPHSTDIIAALDMLFSGI